MNNFLTAGTLGNSSFQGKSTTLTQVHQKHPSFEVTFHFKLYIYMCININIHIYSENEVFQMSGLSFLSSYIAHT